MDRRVLDERRDIGFGRSTELRRRDATSTPRRHERQPGLQRRRPMSRQASSLCDSVRSLVRSGCDHTCFSGIDAGGSGSDDGSTEPLTGGRSWNMKSHFQRSDGFDACSQCCAVDRPAERQRRQSLEAVDAGEPRGDVGADLPRRSV